MTRPDRRPGPDYSHETRLLRAGCPSCAGIDEVGRGPLAGPVVAAAVILDPANLPEGLNDSKLLSPRRRAELGACIMASAVVSIAEASVAEIDEINILQASMLAMRRAIAGLPFVPGHALVDGNRVPLGLPCGADAVIRGDGLCLSISAASIVAKIRRDEGMVTLAQQHPGYGWERNAGYGTAEHLSALKSLGVTPHHRRSFKPVHNMLYQAVS